MPWLRLFPEQHIANCRNPNPENLQTYGNAIIAKGKFGNLHKWDLKRKVNYMTGSDFWLYLLLITKPLRIIFLSFEIHSGQDMFIHVLVLDRSGEVGDCF